MTNAGFLARVHEIADARGTGARIARSVKRADLADRAIHRLIRADGCSPPYELGLAILRRAASLRPSAPSLGLPTTDPEFRAERLGMALRGPFDYRGQHHPDGMRFRPRREFTTARRVCFGADVDVSSRG